MLEILKINTKTLGIVNLMLYLCSSIKYLTLKDALLDTINLLQYQRVK
jgi:hypothetical protein